MFDATQNPGGSSSIMSDDLTSEIRRYRSLGNHWKRYVFSRPLCENKRVLDYGCGYGIGFTAIENCKEYIGLDVDSEAVKWAERNIAHKFPGSRFTTLDEFKASMVPHSFGAIISFEVIEHVRDVTGYLLFLLENATRGGSIVISTPNGAFSNHEPSRFRSSYHYDEYSADELCDLLKPLGRSFELYKEYRLDRLDRIALKEMVNLKSDDLPNHSSDRGLFTQLKKGVVGVVSRYFNGPFFYKIEKLEPSEYGSLNYSTILSIIHA